jgi:hypothetical protein
MSQLSIGTVLQDGGISGRTILVVCSSTYGGSVSWFMVSA